LAIEVLETQIKITPADTQVLKRLSNTLVQEKDYLAASVSLSEGLKVNANNTIALERLKIVNQELQNEELKRLKALQEEDPAQFLADIKDKK